MKLVGNPNTIQCRPMLLSKACARTGELPEGGQKAVGAVVDEAQASICVTLPLLRKPLNSSCTALYWAWFAARGCAWIMWMVVGRIGGGMASDWKWPGGGLCGVGLCEANRGIDCKWVAACGCVQPIHSGAR